MTTALLLIAWTCREWWIQPSHGLHTSFHPIFKIIWTLKAGHIIKNAIPFSLFCLLGEVTGVWMSRISDLRTASLSLLSNFWNHRLFCIPFLGVLSHIHSQLYLIKFLCYCIIIFVCPTSQIAPFWCFALTVVLIFVFIIAACIFFTLRACCEQDISLHPGVWQ